MRVTTLESGNLAMIPSFALSLSAKLSETPTPQVTRAHHGVYFGHKWDMLTRKNLILMLIGCG